MKTILFFTFCQYYPSGGGNDLRKVVRIEGDFTPELIFENNVPLDHDFVNVVTLDENGDSTTRQFTVEWGATREDPALAEAVARTERPRWVRDATPWAGLIPRFR